MAAVQDSLCLTLVRDTCKRTKRVLGYGSEWDKLHQDLAEKVFALLSVTDLLQCQCVCKKWRAVLSSNRFLTLWARVSPRASWFLVYCNSNAIAAYSPVSNSWSNIPVFARCSLDPQQVLLMASSGGLLCFRSRITEYPSLTVCNPVTKCQRSLPSPLQVRHIDILGMVTDKTNNSYKIIVTGLAESNVFNSITEVYDSITGRWVHQCSSQQDFLQLWCGAHAVWCEGSFYCLTHPISSQRAYRLLAYHMQERGWCDLNVEMPSADLRWPSLLACQGRLLLAGRIAVNNSVKSVHIWELDWGTMKWREIASMPSAILLEGHGAYFRCYGNTDLICFSRLRGWQSVVYDLSRKTWQWLPDNKVCKERKERSAAFERNILIGMAFEPNLVASV